MRKNKFSYDYKAIAEEVKLAFLLNPNLPKRKHFALFITAVQRSMNEQRALWYLNGFTPLTEEEINKIIENNYDKEPIFETFAYYIINASIIDRVLFNQEYTSQKLVENKAVPKYVMDAVMKYVSERWFIYKLKKAFVYSFADVEVIFRPQDTFFIFKEKHF
jgi:hypothetical protein